MFKYNLSEMCLYTVNPSYFFVRVCMHTLKWTYVFRYVVVCWLCILYYYSLSFAFLLVCLHFHVSGATAFHDSALSSLSCAK